jgi:hypothetical protein
MIWWWRCGNNNSREVTPECWSALCRGAFEIASPTAFSLPGSTALGQAAIEYVSRAIFCLPSRARSVRQAPEEELNCLTILESVTWKVNELMLVTTTI